MKLRKPNPLVVGVCVSLGADDCEAMSPDEETVPDSMSVSGTTVSNSDSVDILSFEENGTMMNSWDPHYPSFNSYWDASNGYELDDYAQFGI